MSETINDKQSNKMCFEAFLRHLTYLLLNFHVKSALHMCENTTFASVSSSNVLVIFGGRWFGRCTGPNRIHGTANNLADFVW